MADGDQRVYETRDEPLPPRCGANQRIGAAEARWAHNPKVPRSKLGFAIFFYLVGWPSGPRR